MFAVIDDDVDNSNYTFMPNYWEYPDTSKDKLVKDFPERVIITDDAGLVYNASTDGQELPSVPEKNLYPFRETVSEMEMLTRAGEFEEQEQSRRKAMLV